MARKKSSNGRKRDGSGLSPLIDLAVLQGLNGELRQHILALAVERKREGGTVNPKELSAHFGVDLSSVSYHVAELAKVGLLRLKRTEPRRGAQAHFYEAAFDTMLPEHVWEQLRKVSARAAA